MSSHAEHIAAGMKLLISSGMDPLIGPDDPYLTAFPHRLGSAVFFGATLGVLNAIIAMVLSVIPWSRGGFSPKDGIIYLILAALYAFLGYSGEFPVLSILFAFLCPVFFFVPWSMIVRGSREREVSRKTWGFFTCAAAAPVFVIMLVSATSFEVIRDSMVTVPGIRTLSDFYYNHTMLAAHVIRPPADLEQKVITVSDDIRTIGPTPHGTLWIITSDPCFLKGRDLAVSLQDLPCRSIVLPDGRPANAANRIFAEYGASFDQNRKMREGIGLFFYRGPFVFVPVFFVLWLTLFLAGLWDRSRVAAVVCLAGYLALFIPAGKNMYQGYELRKHPERIAQYMLSEHEDLRYLALMTLPREFTDREIMRYARDESPRIRLRALLEAGDRGSPKFLSLYGQVLDDPQLNVRTKACWSLGRIGSPKAAALLRKAFLQDPSWYVRGYAYRALAGTSPVSRTVKIAR